MEPDNLRLDRYLLSAAAVDRPAVCFIGTASGDAQGYIDRFYESFGTLRANLSHLSLFNPPTSDLLSFVLEKDIVYVGGGSTRNMLSLWREWGLDTILRQAWEGGVVMSGLSAGSLCWFEEGVTDSIAPGELLPIRGLGFVNGSHCPHYDGEIERRPAYHRLLKGRLLGDGFAVEDGAALHYVGDELRRVVSSRPDARAYRVTLAGDNVVETAVDTVFLNEDGSTNE